MQLIRKVRGQAAPRLAWVCDKIGRRTTMAASSVLLGGLAVPAYLLASTGGFGNALAGQVLLALGAATANVVPGRERQQGTCGPARTT